MSISLPSQIFLAAVAEDALPSAQATPAPVFIATSAWVATGAIWP